MRALELVIGHRHFRLPAETDLDQLTDRIQEAARVGGAMVELPGPHPVSALITPATSVFLEIITSAEQGHILYPVMDDFSEPFLYDDF
ncbi:hypothetical protein MT349_19895 [Rathayibacter caricis]|uniref:hypothetical protein n=1 Tax=Rathayibacter caricis TaxID=110936 RepID=UPI001FB1DA29|nr:hypothetical protein [Rathayibacter caricis]MCJ1698053.1 hypothetical protein [Rathayibacter caricis]